MIWKNNFWLLPLHCTCPIWGSAHELSARALGTRHLPGTLEFIQSHAPFFNRKNKAQREKKRWFGQDHTVSWWQKQCKYSDRQIPDPGLCKNCIFPHLLCQKVSQHSFQRPGLPHNLLDKVSGLLISREPSAFCHKLHFLIHSKDTWLHVSPWDLAPNAGRIRKYMLTCSKLRLPRYIIKFSAIAPGQWTLARNVWDLERVAASRVPGQLCSKAEAGHVGLSLLWKHLQLSPPLTCASNLETNCLFVAFLSFTLSGPGEAIRPSCWDHFMAKSSRSFRYHWRITSWVRSSRSIPL